MRILGFIVLFFYLGSLFPTAQASAHSSWVDSEPANKPVALSVYASVSQKVTCWSEPPSDTEQPAVPAHQAELELEWVCCPAACFVVELVSYDKNHRYFARAPPFLLN